MFVARKVDPSKWKRLDGLSHGEVPADAITRDFRTAYNKLSLWYCDGISKTDASVQDVALALAAADEHIEKFWLAFVPKNELEASSHVFEDSLGTTAAASLRNRHVNLVQLDSLRLAELAGQFAAALWSDRNCYFTKSQVRKLLIDAYVADELDMNTINQNLLAKIKESLPTSRPEVGSSD